MVRLEFDIVECLFRYWPKRWTSFGATLLLVPGSEQMTIPEIQRHFKERFRIAGRLPSVANNEEVVKVTLMANLPGGVWRDRCSDLLDIFTPLETLEHLVGEYIHGCPGGSVPGV